MDISLCASNRTCPKKDECLRSLLYDQVKPGDIYTTSYFASICNPTSGYSSFIPKENVFNEK